MCTVVSFVLSTCVKRGESWDGGAGWKWRAVVREAERSASTICARHEFEFVGW